MGTPFVMVDRVSPLTYLLGKPRIRVAHYAMVNLIGTIPDMSAVFSVPETHLHLYGKQPRAGRKLGHVTVWTQDAAQLQQRLQELRQRAGL